MRHRSKSSKIELELFPFLSVLACTIGSLILLIIVISTETLDSNQEVTIIAKNEGGINQKKQPRYIECKKEGIVIYPSKELIKKEDLNNSKKFRNFIQEIKANRDKEYIIVAVKPSGIDVFQEVRNLIEQEEIDIGYEPIQEEWQLKISE